MDEQDYGEYAKCPGTCDYSTRATPAAEEMLTGNQWVDLYSIALRQDKDHKKSE